MLHHHRQARPHQRPQPWRKGRPGRAGPPPAPHDAAEGMPWTCRTTTTSTARRGEMGRPGRDGITTRGRSRGRMSRARISTPPPPPWRKGKGGAVPDPPQRQRAAGEGTPWTRRITTTSARSRGGSGRPGRARISPTPRPPGTEERGDHGRAGVTSTRRRDGRNALDILDHPQRQHGTGTPSGVFKSYIFTSGFFYKNTNRRAGAPQGVTSGI